MFGAKKVVILGGGQLGKACFVLFGKSAVLIDRSKLDISDIGGLKLRLHMLLDGINILAIVNCMAYNDVVGAESEDGFLLAQKVNGHALGVIGAYCAVRDIPVVHFSTECVFSGVGDLPHKETDVTSPINKYGETKLLGEKALMETHSKSLIFRLAWVYSVAFDNNFVVKIIEAMSKNSTISVPDDQVGNLCNVFDLSRIIASVLEAIGSNHFTDWGIYHIAPRGFKSRYDIARHIMSTASSFGGSWLKTIQIVPIKTETLLLSARRPLNSRLDSDKFFEKFGIAMPDWVFSLHNATQKIIQRIGVNL